MSKTLENLQAAYAGESNAAAKYAEFAQRAEAEGHAGAAALFRAAVAAEKIHAANHAKEIVKLGDQPAMTIHLPSIQDTLANLDVAIAGETYERDTMYPDFIATAKAENQKGAERTFAWAMAAEAEHAKLYTQAKSNLASFAAPRTFVVCPVCGYTVAHLDGDKCPVCGVRKDKFLTVK